jgi:hypothetical protein
MTFIEITKINSYNEIGKALVRVEDIVGIKEKHVEPTHTYDINGNEVTTTQGPRDFQVLVANECGARETYHIDENEYARLVNLLTK